MSTSIPESNQNDPAADQYNKLKKNLFRASRKIEQKRGAFLRILEELEREYGVDCLEDAIALLKKEVAEKDRMQKKYELQLKALTKEWDELNRNQETS
jgi:phage shock protein A